ncbi:aromatic-L-amino-acid decarboxylase-like [Diadema setosum]|uniref:aromatic-L-amino-acid decarboxylase-like n=1 Tax=Diadema setosum TaxID=31175 RepID=UPI003B3AA5A2
MTNSDDFRVWGKEMVDYISDYQDQIEKRPALAQVSPGYLLEQMPQEAPVKPDEWKDVLSDVERLIMPGVSHWNHPNFHAYFPTANSFAAILGDMVSDAIGCIGFSWIASPACTELEMVMMNWLARMLHLPEEYLFGKDSRGGGVIQGTASEATLVALLAAKMRAIRQQQAANPDLDQYDIMSKLVAYTSDQSHSSVERAALIASVRIRSLQTDEKHALRGETLRVAIEEDKAKGRIPVFVCATLGTTTSCAFDNISELGLVCQEEGIWLHIDAAYAGSSFICPEFRHLLNGVEYADSFNFNPHKFLNVTFDCSTLWTRDRSAIEGAFHVSPAYLKHNHEDVVIDYRHWQIPLGRRFRSLKLWFVFRLFGVEKLQDHVRKQVSLAKEFEVMVAADDRFEIVADVVLGLVCFRLKGSDDVNKTLLDRINSGGKIHMVGSVLKGRYILRLAVCGTHTESRHMVQAWNVIREETAKLGTECPNGHAACGK